MAVTVTIATVVCLSLCVLELSVGGNGDKQGVTLLDYARK
jgi:hypothetical protein